MYKVYANLVMKGLRTIESVPDDLRDDVREEVVSRYAKLIREGSKTIEDVPESLRDAVLELLAAE